MGRLATRHGVNGSTPWGNKHTSAIDSSAQWIWFSDAYNDNNVFFTIAITAVDVPEPTSLAILGLALIDFCARRFKNVV